MLNLKSEDGFAFVLSIVIIGVLSFLTCSVLSIALNENSASRDYYYRTRANFYARAGVEYTLANEVFNESDFSLDEDFEITNDSDVIAEISVQEEPKKIIITSRGLKEDIIETVSLTLHSPVPSEVDDNDGITTRVSNMGNKVLRGGGQSVSIGDTNGEIEELTDDEGELIPAIFDFKDADHLILSSNSHGCFEAAEFYIDDNDDSEAKLVIQSSSILELYADMIIIYTNIELKDEESRICLHTNRQKDQNGMIHFERDIYSHDDQLLIEKGTYLLPPDKSLCISSDLDFEQLKLEEVEVMSWTEHWSN